ncbi:MAG TPA: response regulator [Allosphingosinicella sp.]|nr:response regulator [Allosphingosinicella sp.]
MKRVLICDDDALLVELVRYRLTASGYAVDSAGDGVEGERLLRENGYDAVVLDAMMPAVDGYELLRRIRETPGTRRTPVIMLSARRREEDIVAALKLGANDYVVKPFIPEELVARLARLVDGAAA